MFTYAHHDFTENFLSATGYNDSFMTGQMLMDEIAKLVVDNKQFVVKSMRSHGFNATINDNNKILIKKLFEALSKNDDLKQVISAFIVEKNIDEQKAKKLFIGFAGNKKLNSIGDQIKTINWKDLANDPNVKKTLNDLVNKGITKITSGSKNVGTNEPTPEENLAALQQKVQLAEANEKKMSTGAKVAITIGVVVLIGTIVFFALKGKPQAALAEGGDIDTAAGDAGAGDSANAE